MKTFQNTLSNHITFVILRNVKLMFLPSIYPDIIFRLICLFAYCQIIDETLVW